MKKIKIISLLPLLLIAPFLLAACSDPEHVQEASSLIELYRESGNLLTKIESKSTFNESDSDYIEIKTNLEEIKQIEFRHFRSKKHFDRDNNDQMEVLEELRLAKHSFESKYERLRDRKGGFWKMIQAIRVSSDEPEELVKEKAKSETDLRKALEGE